MNKNQISIDGQFVGPGNRPYIVAELSSNHNGSLDRALQIIRYAKKAGADAVKIQTYRPDTITIDCDLEPFIIRGGLWDGKSLYQLYEEAHMPWEWHQPLFEEAQKLGISIFSSVFDFSSIDFLEELGCPVYKIASFEAVDLPLVEYAAKTGKPLIISTGMTTEREVADVLDTVRKAGCDNHLLLHCVSNYPAKPSEVNLATMVNLRERFNVLIGLSDHTIDNSIALAAVALGAHLIEKHFTLDRNGGGPDDSFSIEPNDLAHLCKACFDVWTAVGTTAYHRSENELKNSLTRRSLYVIKDIDAGESITTDNIKSIRPGFGMSPKHWNQVLGAIARTSLKRGTPLTMNDITIS